MHAWSEQGLYNIGKQDRHDDYAEASMRSLGLDPYDDSDCFKYDYYMEGYKGHMFTGGDTTYDALTQWWNLGKERREVGGNLLSMRAVGLDPLNQSHHALYDSYVAGFDS